MRHKTLPAAAILLMSPFIARGAVMQILFPAYEDPSDTTYWNTLIGSVSPQTPITVIMNPNSGPVSTVDPFYTSTIPTVQAAGGAVIGYVDSDDQNGNTRTLAAVETDVATYKREYSNLNGIFVDDMLNTSQGLSFYKSLYAYIKSENAQWQVFGNPGTTTLESYLSPTPAAADVLVTYENPPAGYTTTPPSAWQLKYPGSNFSNIVYSLSSATTMQSDVTLAMQNRAGYVYFTNDNDSDSDMNPYNLSIASGSTLDLQNADLIVHNGNLTTISGEVISGYFGGTWRGTGITSSTAAANTRHLTAVGVIQNLAQGTAIYTTFDQAAVTTTDVLVKYTYYGDANLDGAVDGSDYTLIDNGFNGHLTGWYNGDFNYDGKIDGSDYSLIDDAFNTQGTSLGSNPLTELATAAVPEPATVGLVLVACTAMGTLRVRRHKTA